MKVIVTGGSGFIGTNLVEFLSSMGCEILNLDISPPRNHDQMKFWTQVDILDFRQLNEEILQFSPKIIYHLAARTDLFGLTLSDYDANTLGVENLIRSIANSTSLKKIIFASSRLVCRIGYIPRSMEDYCPDTLYGQSKVIGEEIVKKLSSIIPCPWIIVRPTSIWGPWFDVPYKNFFLTIYRRQYYHPASMRIKKSFGFVGNTIHQLSMLGSENYSDPQSKIMYLADYDPIDLEEMAITISAEFKRGSIHKLPIVILKSIAVIGDALKKLGWKTPPLTTFRLNNLITPMEYDLEPLKSVVGPLPYTLSEGVKITCKWLIESEG